MSNYSVPGHVSYMHCLIQTLQLCVAEIPHSTDERLRERNSLSPAQKWQSGTGFKPRQLDSESTL